MAPLLHGLSYALPLTYAYDALAQATSPDALDAALAADIAIIAGTTLAALGLGALTLRRQTD